MTNEEKIEEIANIIYSQCGVTIRNDESHSIAKKLVELGYEKKSETAKDVIQNITDRLKNLVKLPIPIDDVNIKYIKNGLEIDYGIKKIEE